MDIFIKIDTVDYIVFKVWDTSALNTDQLQSKLDHTTPGADLVFVTEGETDSFFNDSGAEEEEDSNEVHANVLKAIHQHTTPPDEDIEGGLIGVFLPHHEDENEESSNLSNIFTVMRMVRESKGGVKLSDLSQIGLLQHDGLSVIYFGF